MRDRLTEYQMYNLEKLIDSTSMAAVINALDTIAHEKAMHIRGVWHEDGELARQWDHVGFALSRVHENANIQKVSA